MSNEGNERPASSTPTRVHLVLGLALIGLAITRGWNDSVQLVSYVSHDGFRLVFAPATVPWDEFSGVACAAWPILLGFLLIRSRSDRLLKAVAITALVLGFERLFSLAVGGLFDSGWRELYRGSWDRTRGPVGPRGLSLLASIASAVAWLLLGGWAWLLALRARAGTWSQESVLTRDRRRAKPRLSNICATFFAVGILSMTSWVTYITVLDRLPWVRNLVLGGDRPRQSPFVAVDTPQGRRFREADRYLAEGQGLQAKGRFLDARQAFVKATNRYEALMEDYPKARVFRRQFAFAANNLAWFLSTCPEKAVREPEVAVLLAKKAVAIDPGDGNALNTLAVAHFRAGELDAAKAAFEKSMELRGGGDGYDWFFLAQVEAIQGRPDSAKSIFDKAVAWTAENRSRNPELFQFHVEAADRLKLPRPEMPAIDDTKTPVREGPIIFVPNSRRGRVN